MLSEKEVDALIENSFRGSDEFVSWFLRKTKFNRSKAKYAWSRSDHPWGKVTFKSVDEVTGDEVELSRESETDVLVVLETDSGDRFAFHIENKLANGHFTPFQPEMYRHRAENWLGIEKYGSYRDYETILFAPLAFYRNNYEASKSFDRYVSYEEASLLIPELLENCE